MTLEELDRSIYEAIRLKIVSVGRLPDIKLYENNPEGYTQAKNTLRDSLNDKTLIEVFGVGNSSSRDELINSRITINRGVIEEGNIGSFGVQEYILKDNQKFDKVVLPSNTEDVNYDIRIFCSTISQERLIKSIIYKALGQKKYLKSYLTEEVFLLTKVGDSNVSATNLTEIIIKYVASDLFLNESELIETDIPKMISANLKDENIKLF